MARRARFVYKSNYKGIVAFHRLIATQAVRAATMVVWRQAKMNARGGFGSGDFVTGGWSQIGWAVKAGTHHAAVGQVGAPQAHFAYWEFGHQNIFTRQYERNRWLSKAFISTPKKQQEAATAAVRKVVAGAPTVLRKSFIAGLSGGRTSFRAK